MFKYFSAKLRRLVDNEHRHFFDGITGLKGCNIHKTVTCDKYFNITHNGGDFTLQIEENVYFRNYCHLLVYPGSTLVIHKNVFFNNYCSINCLGNIEIGENTLFGEGVKLYDHNHRHAFDNGTLKVERNAFTIGRIKIGSNCWIGSNVTILNNVEIGDNVIIGAHCLIYKSIPANSIVKLQQNLHTTQQ